MSHKFLQLVWMALHNDDLFVMRIRAACGMLEVAYDEQVAYRVIAEVADQITTGEGPSIRTDDVDDDRILMTIGTLHGKTSEAFALIAAFTPNP